MYRSDFDLQQLDEQLLPGLPAEQKEARRVKWRGDLKAARERLKANSQTRSWPPSRASPWHGKDLEGEESEAAGEARGEVAPAAEVSKQS